MTGKPSPQQGAETRFRLIVDKPGNGQWNMAVDEALLEAVSAGESSPVVRLYGFAPGTLSVGRFQATAELVDFDRLSAEGVGFVRRPTGGQAVLHIDELTYAFVIGRNHIDPFGKRWVYRFVAPLLVSGLEELGLHGIQSSTAQRGSPTNPDCFGSTGEYEIDSPSGRKLVGSAQMVSRTGVLQHGSIPLSPKGREIVRYLRLPDPSGNHATNLREETGHEVDLPAAREAFIRSLGDHLPVESDGLRPTEEKRAAELMRCKYSTDQWNRRY